LVVAFLLTWHFVYCMQNGVRVIFCFRRCPWTKHYPKWTFHLGKIILDQRDISFYILKGTKPSLISDPVQALLAWRFCVCVCVCASTCSRRSGVRPVEPSIVLFIPRTHIGASVLTDTNLLFLFTVCSALRFPKALIDCSTMSKTFVVVVVFKAPGDKSSDYFWTFIWPLLSF